MHATDDPNTPEHNPGATLYGMYVMALAASGLGNLLIRIGDEAGWFPPSAKLALALAASVPLVVWAVYFWRFTRRNLDEMLQRVVMEGLAFGFVIFIPIAFLYVNLKTAGIWTPRLDPPDILLMPAILVAVGVALAYRRYA